MRPGQNRRSRGRNNNNGGGNNNNGNRRNQNPLARTYESSGPDVKIRGNPQHIAERYTTLARDALSSGDRVMAENYLQHAEHYNRIIAAANLAMQEQRRDRDDDDMDDGDDQDMGETGGDAVAAERPRDNSERENGNRDGGNRDNGNREQGQRRERPFRERPQREQGNDAPRAEVQPDVSATEQPDIDGTPREFADAAETPVAKPRRRRAPRARVDGEAPAAADEAPADGGSETATAAE